MRSESGGPRSTRRRSTAGSGGARRQVPSKLRSLANTLGVRPEAIALPLWQPWVMVRGHRFHLAAQAYKEELTRWVAREVGWDWADAVEWPLRAVDSEYPDFDSPSIIESWRANENTAGKALADRIVVAMEAALSAERLPAASADRTPDQVAVTLNMEGQ